MKIQATKIEAGQTIKLSGFCSNLAIVKANKEILKTLEEGTESYNEYLKSLAKHEAYLAKGIDGTFLTHGKHTLEYKVLEVKEYAKYIGVNLGNRTLGANYTLLVTDKGSYLIPNRNKVTLVD